MLMLNTIGHNLRKNRKMTTWCACVYKSSLSALMLTHTGRNVACLFAVPKRNRGKGYKFRPTGNTVDNDVLDRHRDTSYKIDSKQKPEKSLDATGDYRHVYPEFLPNPIWYRRDKISELLERKDMFQRRKKIEINEFYVGSILSVTVADKYGSERKNKFTGICVQRGGHGLRAYFILRNVIDNQGIEVKYEMYSPHIQRIDVLRLEKRLDDDLMYLRDAPKEYSTIPLDLPQITLPKGVAIPINTIKVPLNPRPWLERWERQNLRGAILPPLSEKVKKKAAKAEKQPWETCDLMKQYRAGINEDDAHSINQEIHKHRIDIDKYRKPVNENEERRQN